MNELLDLVQHLQNLLVCTENKELLLVQWHKKIKKKEMILDEGQTLHHCV